ncbi:hypothetical protein Cbu04g_40130 (plasmid) [Clostridium butyricum]|nr:hypothetical protein Cbu04g_40130 [Clostridium butyricum]
MRMIKPDKHFNIETSIIKLGSIAIRELLKSNSIKFKDLFYLILDDYEDLDFEEFMYCLSFLYSIGIIEFYKNDRSIKLIQKSNIYEFFEKISFYFQKYITGKDGDICEHKTG